MDTVDYHSAESSPKKIEISKALIPMSTQVHIKMQSRNTTNNQNNTAIDVVQEKMDEILIRINKSSNKQQA